eukprot:TRINITY_DN5626_c0_g1_i1.p1 TRINITY_DN5626_c0_g1~~TRINITY_DN5626_c0_g1_i1.p1  ORF type:complete len:547 (+),score=136.96 TRINITY_DN5626_c0_g1_i1:158-1798(+)
MSKFSDDEEEVVQKETEAGYSPMKKTAGTKEEDPFSSGVSKQRHADSSPVDVSHNAPFLYDPEAHTAVQEEKAKEEVIQPIEHLPPKGSVLKIWEGSVRMHKTTKLNAIFYTCEDTKVVRKFPMFTQTGHNETLRLHGFQQADVCKYLEDLLVRQASANHPFFSGWVCPVKEEDRSRLEEYSFELHRLQKIEGLKYPQGAELTLGTLYILNKSQLRSDLLKRLDFKCRDLPDHPKSDLLFIVRFKSSDAWMDYKGFEPVTMMEVREDEVRAIEEEETTTKKEEEDYSSLTSGDEREVPAPPKPAEEKPEAKATMLVTPAKEETPKAVSSSAMEVEPPLVTTKSEPTAAPTPTPSAMEVEAPKKRPSFETEDPQHEALLNLVERLRNLPPEQVDEILSQLDPGNREKMVGLLANAPKTPRNVYMGQPPPAGMMPAPVPPMPMLPQPGKMPPGATFPQSQYWGPIQHAAPQMAPPTFSPFFLPGAPPPQPPPMPGMKVPPGWQPPPNFMPGFPPQLPSPNAGGRPPMPPHNMGGGQGRSAQDPRFTRR